MIKRPKTMFYNKKYFSAFFFDRHKKRISTSKWINSCCSGHTEKAFITYETVWLDILKDKAFVNNVMYSENK